MILKKENLWKCQAYRNQHFIYLNVNNLSLTDPFDFSLEGSLWSRGKNIGVTGTAEIDLSGPGLQLSNVKVTSDLSDLSGDMLKCEGT